MSRILFVVTLVLASVPGRTASAAGESPDSKAWGKVSTTTGPPRPGAIDDQRVKLARLDSLVRGWEPAGAAQVWRMPSPARSPSAAPPPTVGTSRPYAGAALATSEARIRAKVEASARPVPAPRTAASPGQVPPKPGVAPALRPTPSGIGKRTPPVTRTEIPGSPLNDEQRAKLERARAAERAGAGTCPPRVRP